MGRERWRNFSVSATAMLGRYVVEIVGRRKRGLLRLGEKGEAGQEEEGGAGLGGGGRAKIDCWQSGFVSGPYSRWKMVVQNSRNSLHQRGRTLSLWRAGFCDSD